MALIAEGNLDVSDVDEREYSSYSHEAMIALLKIDQKKALSVLEDFLLDGLVDSGDKVDIIRNFKIKDLRDVERLISALSNVDKKDIAGLDKISAALVHKLKSEMKTYISNDTVVQLDGTTKAFGQYSEVEKGKILSSKRENCRSLLVRMNFGGDVQVATQALTLIPDQLTGAYGRQEIFDVYGGVGEPDHISHVSVTVLKAMPGFVFGTSVVDVDHSTVITETDKTLARAGLKKARNITNPEDRANITLQFFLGFEELLKMANKDPSKVSANQLDAYVDSMVAMYRKLSLADREEVQLDNREVTGNLNKLPRFLKAWRLKRKLRKVGFSSTDY